MCELFPQGMHIEDEINEPLDDIEVGIMYSLKPTTRPPQHDVHVAFDLSLIAISNSLPFILCI